MATTVDLHPDIVRAIRDFSHTPLGRKYNRFTERKYGLPGWKVEGKTIAGEFGGRSSAAGRGVVSSAGARGPAQFIPGTRRDFIREYGIDPWKNDASAVKALAIHQMTRGGIAGYNPGDPGYQQYIMGQRLNASDRHALRGGARGGGGGSFDLRGPAATDVSLQSHTIPGQSFAADRKALREDLFLKGPLTMNRLLAYKQQADSLQDVPDRKVSDLKVTRYPGQKLQVRTRGAASHAVSGAQASVANGKIIGTPYTGTHNLGNWQSDNAVDVSLKLGTKVRIPRNAVVEKVAGSYKGGASRFDGYQVTVRLANGNRLFYTHLSRSSVKPGQRLRAGQVVGRSGAANGVPHLHLGAERGNPRKFVG